MRQVDTDAHRQVGEWHEGDDIGCPHAWVLAAMLAQVDSFGGDRGAGHRRVNRLVGRRHKGHHHPVVRGISLDIDDPRSRAADGVGDRADHVLATALRKIRDALYEGRQTTPPATV